MVRRTFIRDFQDAAWLWFKGRGPWSESSLNLSLINHTWSEETEQPRCSQAQKPFSASEHVRLERNHFLDVAAELRGRNIDQYLRMTHLLASATLFSLTHTFAHASAQPIPESGCWCAASRSLCQITSQTCCLTHQRLLVTSGSLPLSDLPPTPPPFYILCVSRWAGWDCVDGGVFWSPSSPFPPCICAFIYS